jgi:superfamily II DNA or RNA helicase
MSRPTSRDPRRLFSAAERAQIAARQHHTCKHCSGDLQTGFHVHHVIPHAAGGRTHPDNGIAVCEPCHPKAAIHTIPNFIPRHWQQEALPTILRILRAKQFATVNAAPGAGKTAFSAWALENLFATEDVVRVVIFGPNTHLRNQWKDELAERGLFIRSDSVSERRDEDGVVLTYHALLDPAKLQQMIDDAAARPTLIVADEVHHLAKDPGGQAGAWAVNFSRLVGTIENPLHPVLNLSGTLFRSKKSERVSTINYVEADDGTIETVADYSVFANELIEEGVLRRIKVLAFDADMHVDAVNLGEEAGPQAQFMRAVDLDDNGLRSRVLPQLVRNDRFLTGIIGETATRLGHASVALGGAPVKGLIVADDVRHAEQVHAELSRQLGPRLAFIATSDTPNADAEIERFRMSREQGLLVAVQKVTEGFNVPDICVLTYLRTWKASLFINQMAGRAMRVTMRERELGQIIPATILIPNDPAIRSTFAEILVGTLRVLEAPPEPCPTCGREICACPPRPRHRQCRVCGQAWKFCTCPCQQCGLTKATGCVCWRRPSPICAGCGRPERFCQCFGPALVDVTSDVELANININGNDVSQHVLDSVREHLVAVGLPSIFHEQAAKAIQDSMQGDPLAYAEYLRRRSEQ